MPKSTKAVLNAGVAGAGVFGGYHCRKYAEAAGVFFKGIFDTRADRAAALAAPYGAEGFGPDQLEAFLDGLDVLTLATPAVAHAE
jgi:predicted dehydrogenase